MFLRPAGVIALADGVFWILLLIGCGFLVYAAARGWSQPAVGAPQRADGALAILSARYARGEISREEYLQMRADITASGGGA
jgi:uncharacterized membrane protein